jgi:hypothetical protein
MSALSRAPATQQTNEQTPTQEVATTQTARPKSNAAGPPTKPNATQGEDQKKVAQQLGTVSSMGDFSKLAGKLVESIAPKPNRQGALKLAVNFPIGGGGLAVGFTFDGSVSRGDKKLSVGFEVGVTGTAKLDVWIAEVFAQARVFGYIEASGDSGAECLRLIGLAIDQRIRQVRGGGKVADLLFGKDYAGSVAKGMDKDDSVESGLGASLEVGAKVDKEHSAQASASAQAGTKITANNGQLKKQDTQRYKKAVSFQADPFQLTGTFVEAYLEGKLDSMDFTVSGSRQMTISESIENIQNNKIFQKVMAKAQKVLSGLSSRAGCGGALGALGSLAGQAQSVGPAIESGTKSAIERLKGLENKIPYKCGWQISASLKWANGQTSLSLRLEKVSNITWGQDRSDPVYLAIGNMQQVFELKLP